MSIQKIERKANKQKMISKDREYRFFEIRAKEQEEQEEKREEIEGYAVIFDDPTCLYEMDGVKYYEVIDRHALDKAQLDDVVLNFNHGGKPVARTRNKTLNLEIDEKGLKVRAYLGGTEEGRKLYEEVKGGYLDKMSFAFIYDDEKYDKKSHTNTITSIQRLFDVSVVDFPAYDSTSVNARSQNTFLMEIEKERMEMRSEKRDALMNKLLKIDLERKLRDE